MEKEQRRNKNRKGPRGNDLAQFQKQPAAHLALSRTGTPSLSLPLADRWDPPVSTITSTVSSPLSHWKRKLAGVNAPTNLASNGHQSLLL
jgi:hypothetical protein